MASPPSPPPPPGDSNLFDPFATLTDRNVDRQPGSSADWDGPDAEDETDPAEPAPVVLTCPNCGQHLDVVLGAAARYEACPACGQHFVAPGRDGSAEVRDEEEEERLARREAEFNDIRMRQIVADKRAAIRSRTYCLLGAFLCVIGAAKLVTLAWGYVKLAGGWRWQLPPVGYLILAAGAAGVSVHLARRSSYWNRESLKTALPEPESPPHFEGLSDGSDQWKRLDEVQ